MRKEIAGYEIIAEVGHGGMATVYRARATASNGQSQGDVAIKLLRREYLTDLGFRARFEREGETITALDHEAIVPVYEFGQYEEQLYIVMAYMPYGSLAQRLLQGALPLATTMKVVARVAAALDYAHLKGIVHRDLKPSNVLFDAADEAYLADFGIAWVAESGGRDSGTITGTPAYMSPEQARREDAVSPASDQYALGVLAYQLLVGRLPFQAETPVAVLVQHMQEAPPSPLKLNPALPADVEPVLWQALAKEPEKRYESATAFAADLRRALAGEPVVAAAGTVVQGAGLPRAGSVEASGETGAEGTPERQSTLQTEEAGGWSGVRQWMGRLERRARPQRQRLDRWLAASPASAVWLVTLLGLVCALAAVLVVRGDELRAGQGREATVVSTEFVAGMSTPAVFLPIARLEVGRVAPTPTPPPTPGPNVRMLYDGGAISLLNISAQHVALSDLALRRVSSDGSPSASLPLRMLRGVAGSAINALPPGDCLLLLSTDAVRSRGPGKPEGCGTLRGWLATRETNQLFQGVAEGDSFEVLRDEQVLQSCALEVGSCQLLVAQSQ